MEKKHTMVKRLSGGGVGFLFVLLWAINGFCETQQPVALAFPGEEIVNYEEYGEFKNRGTAAYSFIVKDKAKLADAVGEGIFPDEESVTKDPLYQKYKAEGKLEGSHWEHVYTDDPFADFFVWATAQEDPGVKLFFTANALKEAGLITQAIKAYYAILVHFPRSACFSDDQSFVWYVASQAIDKIHSLCRKYPGLGMRLEGAFLDIRNGYDTDLKNDVIKVNPGRIVRIPVVPQEPVDLNTVKVVERRGKGKVQFVKYKNGHWQMLVDNKPFIVKGISYAPSKTGESPHKQTLRNWMFCDDNKNGIIDAPYEAWVDENKNNIQESGEKAVGDFALMKDMGCNAIRYYHVSVNNQYSPGEFNKELLRDLYQRYGIMVIMGDFLGAYTVGSGADWYQGTDYSDRVQCARMKEIVRRMVLDHKDEPYVLMWLLGNENNKDSDYLGINATRTRAAKQPKVYARFLNEVAGMIHELDPDHPVAIGNFEEQLMEYYNRFAPEIDILGVNYYTDKDGFGDLWRRIRKKMDRPILITEYGCDAFDTNKNKKDEQGQMQWHKGNWQDIHDNSAGYCGEGNSVGGVIYEWLDEWWKSSHGRPYAHDATKDCSMSFPDGVSSEEWLGITGQGNGTQSPFLRQLRKTYFMYKDLWKETLHNSPA